MTGAGEPDPLADALLAARLCALDPAGLGGLILRGGGEARDAVIDELRRALPSDAPFRRIPPHVADEALLGGLDLTATLASGRPVRRAGLLAAADGGVVVVPMAERLSGGIAARIAGALDTGDIEGAPARFVLVVLDDGLERDERPPAALIERLAFRIDLTAAQLRPGSGGSQLGPGFPGRCALHQAVAEEQMAALAATGRGARRRIGAGGAVRDARRPRGGGAGGPVGGERR